MTNLALIMIIAATAAWLILPLTRPRPEQPDESSSPAAELEARRSQLLLALQDLDFELQTGKLSPEDHAALRSRLQAEAVAVMQKLEQARA